MRACLLFTLASALALAAHAQFVQQGGKLVGTGATGSADQGQSVAVSADGNTAVIAGTNGLAVSSNAGQSWQNVAVDAQLEDVDLTEDGTAVAVGLEGAIVQYANGEVSLQHVGTADLHTLHLADSSDALDIGFAGGDNGEVLVTDDAGASWTVGPNLGNHTILGIDQIGAGHR